jgi:hypothetical protein
VSRPRSPGDRPPNCGRPSVKAIASVVKAKAAQLRWTEVPLKDGYKVHVAATRAVGVERDRNDQVKPSDHMRKELVDLRHVTPCHALHHLRNHDRSLAGPDLNPAVGAMTEHLLGGMFWGMAARSKR